MLKKTKTASLILGVFLASFFLGFYGFSWFGQAAFAQNKTITVVSPNGGEKWRVGTTKTITWTSTGDIDMVKIWAEKEGIRAGLEDKIWMSYIIISQMPNTGSYRWTIPADILRFDPGYSWTGNFKICVESLGGLLGIGNVKDCSDNPFNIRGKGSIGNISPRGGEQWRVKSTYKISWAGVDVDKVGIVLYKGREIALQIATDIPNLGDPRRFPYISGEYSWTIPEILAPATNYYIGVYEYPWEEGGLVGYSSGPFSIIHPEVVSDTGRYGLYGYCVQSGTGIATNISYEARRCRDALWPASCKEQVFKNPHQGGKEYKENVCACPSGYRQVAVCKGDYGNYVYSCYKE